MIARAVIGAAILATAPTPMVTRFWPLESGRIITSPFGKRGNEFHAGGVACM